jgi:hypothetical protein
MNQSRQEGYYWVKYKDGPFSVAFWNLNWMSNKPCWAVIGNEDMWQDSDFEHINEVRIKEPGELPD